MPSTLHQSLDLSTWARAFRRGVASWWHLIHFCALVLVLALSPSTYNRANRVTTFQQIYASTWQVLPWFTALSALLSLVLIRIVVVTALSYGLSQYALQMVVRVLVLELIPLAAALFVALRAGLTFNAGLPRNTLQALEGPTPSPTLEHLRHELVPSVMASAFSVVTLAMLSSVIALVLAYLTVYGVTLWGLPGYTRTVGQVFDLTVTLGFLLKTLLFSLAVAVVPMAANLEAARRSSTASTLQPGAVRLFLVLLWIEAASLAVKYI
ncbi:MAG: ABC transporter permease [Pseudomonadota bacterium]